MKIATHITFFYIEERLIYLKEVVDNVLSLEEDITVFIYTNKKFDFFRKYSNVNLLIYAYTTSSISRFSFNSIFNKIGLKKLIHPFYLTWEHREIVERKINEFDVQIYLEDDIKFTLDNLNYWLENNETVTKKGYNLGFLRIESSGEEYYITDITSQLTNTITIENRLYVINDNNPYCGFWIYSKKELKEFIKSKEWRFKIKGYGIREKAAIGWHGENMNKYKGTIIPLVKKDNTYVTHNNSRVYHLPNNYIGHASFCSYTFPLEIVNKKEHSIE